MLYNTCRFFFLLCSLDHLECLSSLLVMTRMDLACKYSFNLRSGYLWVMWWTCVVVLLTHFPCLSKSMILLAPCMLHFLSGDWWNFRERTSSEKYFKNNTTFLVIRLFICKEGLMSESDHLLSWCFDAILVILVTLLGC
jgi:hypothetical protein